MSDYTKEFSSELELDDDVNILDNSETHIPKELAYSLGYYDDNLVFPEDLTEHGIESVIKLSIENLDLTPIKTYKEYVKYTGDKNLNQFKNDPELLSKFEYIDEDFLNMLIKKGMYGCLDWIDFKNPNSSIYNMHKNDNVKKFIIEALLSNYKAHYKYERRSYFTNRNNIVELDDILSHPKIQVKDINKILADSEFIMSDKLIIDYLRLYLETANHKNSDPKINKLNKIKSRLTKFFLFRNSEKLKSIISIIDLSEINKVLENSNVNIFSKYPIYNSITHTSNLYEVIENYLSLRNDTSFIQESNHILNEFCKCIYGRIMSDKETYRNITNILYDLYKDHDIKIVRPVGLLLESDYLFDLDAEISLYAFSHYDSKKCKFLIDLLNKLSYDAFKKNRIKISDYVALSTINDPKFISVLKAYKNHQETIIESAIILKGIHALTLLKYIDRWVDLNKFKFNKTDLHSNSHMFNNIPPEYFVHEEFFLYALNNGAKFKDISHNVFSQTKEIINKAISLDFNNIQFVDKNKLYLINVPEEVLYDT